jgi:DNA repair photolyase
MPLKTTSGDHGAARKGRGATANLEGRFERWARQAEDDGWASPDEEATAPKTVVTEERAKSAIQRNDSPDIPFTWSINPYRGCEHGCVYCYARPTHAYLGLSPGLDFETRLFAKVNAAELLAEELSRPGYRCEGGITIGANTDGYQPVERKLGITRGILEVLRAAHHPVSIITKNALVERDIDLLAPMAKEGLVEVTVSVTTLDAGIARHMEPRASAPARRIEAIRRLAEAGIPTAVNVAPVIPFLTDSEMEAILEQAGQAGAGGAGYILVRLPWEVKDLFREWLEQRFPLKAAHVMSRIHAMREGRDNDPRFGHRMKGSGEFADLLKRRFELACQRLGISRQRHGALDCTRFSPPHRGPQLDLF